MFQGQPAACQDEICVGNCWEAGEGRKDGEVRWAFTYIKQMSMRKCF